MAGKTVKRREWTKEDVRILKTLTKEGTKRSVIARKLKRSEDANSSKGIHPRRVAACACQEEPESLSK